MKYFFTLIFINLLLINPTFTQDAFEGIVIFKIEYQDLADEMAGMEEMLPKKMITKIKGNKTRTEQISAMGHTITINDGDKKTSTSLINTLEKKAAITMTKVEMEIEKSKLGNDAPVQIEYYDETKEIAGYLCHKADISLEGTSDVLTIYYTKKIQSDKVGAPFEGLEGFPMEYKISTQGTSMILTATAVKQKEISKTAFIIPEDYQKVTSEKFQKILEAQMDQE